MRDTKNILLLFMIVGIACLFNYLGWWLGYVRLNSPLLLVLFGGAMAYSLVQLLGNWVLQFAACVHQRESGQEGRRSEPTVDVFLTTNGEDGELVKRALSAATAMSGPHRTWLLDDASDPGLSCLAEELGASHLTREGNHDAKAGNLNAALTRTNGDLVAIFDIDHAPLPDFLKETIGYFDDPQVGFVQVMLTFGGDNMGTVANAAADSSLDFYNAVSVGADALGGATLIGSNAIIRRTALESIGGYKPGLAEDLATSIALHAAGWKSIYVHEPLAPGYAPPDLAAWFTQQMKWARGVFELLLTAYPRKFLALTWRQKLIYAVRMTYYWIGLVVAAHLMMTLLVLLSNSPEAILAMESYLRRLCPLAAATIGIRYFALKQSGHQSLNPGHPLRSLSLIYLTWPVYTLAWFLALFRVPIRFRPTPKSSNHTVPLKWLLPQTIALLGLAIGLGKSLVTAVDLSAWLLLAFVAAQAIGQLLPFFFIDQEGVTGWLAARSDCLSQTMDRIFRQRTSRAK